MEAFSFKTAVAHAEGRPLSFSDFYVRRVRRIFPALIVVLAATLAVGVTIFLPSELTSLARNALASAFFGANFVLLSESGYFDLAAHLKPLLHLWSLGIEEQFYLVWPLALWLTPRTWRGAMIAVVMAASFALNVAQAQIVRFPVITVGDDLDHARRDLSGERLHRLAEGFESARARCDRDVFRRESRVGEAEA